MKAVVILALCCVYASAQSKEKIGDLFDVADTDKSGFVTLSEYVRYFSVFDLDKDGTVSKDEFVAAWIAATGSSAVVGEKIFGLKDYNKDGQLSVTELEQAFAGYDHDGNGLVSKADFLAPLDQILA